MDQCTIHLTLHSKFTTAVTLSNLGLHTSFGWLANHLVGKSFTSLMRLIISCEKYIIRNGVRNYAHNFIFQIYEYMNIDP